MSGATDTWRVCGKPVTTGKSRGCTCNSYDPSPLLVTDAVNRLNRERLEAEDERSPRSAGRDDGR